MLYMPKWLTLTCPDYSKYLQSTQIPEAKIDLASLPLDIFPYYDSLRSRFTSKCALLLSSMLLSIQVPPPRCDHLSVWLAVLQTNFAKLPGLKMGFFKKILVFWGCFLQAQTIQGSCFKHAHQKHWAGTLESCGSYLWEQEWWWAAGKERTWTT